MKYYVIGLIDMKKILRLSKEIYKKEKITKAKEAFLKLADIYLNESNLYFECTFANCKYDEIKTIFEFENFLIGISNSERI